MLDVIELCKKVIDQKSYSGHEDGVVKAIKSYVGDTFDEVNVDKLGNVCLVLNGKTIGKTIVMDGHIDTVPVNLDNWKTDPFKATEISGKIFGRGTSDMKGAVSAMIVGAANFKAAHPDFAGKIVVSCSVHEETFEGVAVREVTKTYKPDFVVIGEATNLDLNRGQRGRAEIVVETFGKSVHSANPEAGVNAVDKMVPLLAKIQQLTPVKHPVLGDGILALTDIKSSPYPGKSVLPDGCRVTFDRRTLVGETKESVLAPIQAIIDEMSANDADFKAKVYYAYGKEDCYTGEVIEAERFFPAWVYDEEADFVKDTLAALREKELGENLRHYSFCTNGSHFAGELGIKTLGFGPSLENLAHTDNEYIELNQLQKAVTGYEVILDTLLKEK